MINKKAVISIKLNTHDRTPRPRNSKFINGMFLLLFVLEYFIFGMVAFACIYYAESFIGGILVIFVAACLTAIILIPIKDLEKAHVEITDKEILVVDYYWGVRKEKHVLFSDITSAEVVPGSSIKIKGERIRQIPYIVLRNNKKYLFKIIYLPETEEIFKQYIQ